MTIVNGTNDQKTGAVSGTEILGGTVNLQPDDDLDLMRRLQDAINGFSKYVPEQFVIAVGGYMFNRTVPDIVVAAIIRNDLWMAVSRVSKSTTVEQLMYMARFVGVALPPDMRGRGYYRWLGLPEPVESPEEDQA